MSDQPRPVWITEEDLLRDPRALAAVVWEQYKVAPADPTEAVRDILLDTQGHARLDDVAAILAALGHPDAE